jgi:hypothetical protein
VSEHLTLPNEHPGPRKDEQTNRTDRIEHVRDTDSIHPSRHSKDEDSAKHIPQESERSQRVANDICKMIISQRNRKGKKTPNRKKKTNSPL